MTQVKYLSMAAVLCSISLMAYKTARAEDSLANYRTPDPPTPAIEALLSESSEQALTEADEVAEAETLTCPPGQFPSAFADVYPFHWAYQAINNLASPKMECFDLPEEYR